METTVDVTTIVQAVIALISVLVSTYVVPYLKAKSNDSRVATAINIANQVVRAARELDITEELISLGKDKANYAFDEMKKALEAKNITISDDEIKAYIKSAVTQLRIELNATDKSLTA